MPSPRTRRLQLDNRMLNQRFANSPMIRITGSAAAAS